MIDEQCLHSHASFYLSFLRALTKDQTENHLILCLPLHYLPLNYSIELTHSVCPWEKDSDLFAVGGHMHT